MVFLQLEPKDTVCPCRWVVLLSLIIVSSAC